MSSNKTEASSSQRGGEGFDEKLYRSYGDCGTQVDVKEVVAVSGDYTSASLRRENCNDLRAPRAIPMSELKFAESTQSVFSRNNRVFDLKTQSSAQKITTRFCESSGSVPTVQSLIWEIVGDSSSLYGSVTESAGPNTGTLRVDFPSAAQPLRYITSAAQTSRFDLNLSAPAAGSLNYAINGGANIAAPNMVCATQQTPQISIVRSSSALATVASATQYTYTIPATASGNLMVLGLMYHNTQFCTNSISDNAGNTYTMANANAYFVSGNSEVWYVPASLAGASQITFNTCGERPSVFYLEVAGIDNASPIDGAPAMTTNGPASNLLTAPPVSTSGPALIFSMGHPEQGVSELAAGSPFTAMNLVDRDAAAYLVSESAGSFGALWNQVTFGRFCSSTIAFKGR